MGRESEAEMVALEIPTESEVKVVEIMRKPTGAMDLDQQW